MAQGRSLIQPLTMEEEEEEEEDGRQRQFVVIVRMSRVSHPMNRAAKEKPCARFFADFYFCFCGS